MSFPINELRAIIDRNEDTLVINVLPSDSYEAGHIPGSINIPLNQDDFVDQVERQSTGRDQQIITYCTGPACDASHRAASLLRDAGFAQAVPFTGGMEQWTREGHPVAVGVAAL